MTDKTSKAVEPKEALEETEQNSQPEVEEGSVNPEEDEKEEEGASENEDGI